MPTSDHIRESLRQTVLKNLGPLLNRCYESHLFGTNTIQLYVKEHKDTISDTVVLRLSVRDDSKEVQIPTIGFPRSWTGNRIGMALIADIFKVCERYGYRLFIVQMVDSFYRYMSGLGCRRIDSDTVEILRTTRLRPAGHDEPCGRTAAVPIPDPLSIGLEEMVRCLTAGDHLLLGNVFVQVEMGGVVNIVQEGAVVEAIKSLQELDNLCDWSGSGEARSL